MVHDYVFTTTSTNRLQDSLLFQAYGYMDKANITQYMLYVYTYTQYNKRYHHGLCRWLYTYAHAYINVHGYVSI